MTTATVLARYILQKRCDNGHSTTTFALQKLLYLCKGWSLATTGDPIFSDAMSAWTHGPVVDSTWPYCRGKRYISSDEIPYFSNEVKLSDSQMHLVDRVLGMFTDIEDRDLGDRLEKLSHKQDPWRNARLTDDEIITDVSLKSYFEKIQAEPPEDQKKYVPLLADLSDSTVISDDDMKWLESTFGVPSKSIDSFSCGNHDMDEWFVNNSRQQQIFGSTNVYTCQSADGEVLGFFTLSNHSLRRQTFSDESRQTLSGGNIPVVLLGKLGVSDRHNDEGIGHYLVEQAKFMASQSARIAAARFLYVQAKKDDLITWYVSQGFVSMPKNNRNMVFDLHGLPDMG